MHRNQEIGGCTTFKLYKIITPTKWYAITKDCIIYKMPKLNLLTAFDIR